MSADTMPEFDNNATSDHKGLLRHQVFFWLRNPDSDVDRQKLIAGIEAMRSIAVIRELHVGIPAKTEERAVVDHSFSVSETMVFENSDDQLAYQLHPAHLAFVAECEHLWSKVAVFDSMDV